MSGQLERFPGQPADLPPRPDPPQSILNAVKLMYAGAVLSALSAIAGLLTTGRIRSTIEKAQPHLSHADLESAFRSALISIVVSGIIGILLWLWMAQMNKQGKSWARVVGTVFFGLATIGLISDFAQHIDVFSLIMTALVWLAGLGAVVFLWQKESSAFFAASRRV